jgi:hypothetical protein
MKKVNVLFRNPDRLVIIDDNGVPSKFPINLTQPHYVEGKSTKGRLVDYAGTLGFRVSLGVNEDSGEEVFEYIPVSTLSQSHLRTAVLVDASVALGRVEDRMTRLKDSTSAVDQKELKVLRRWKRKYEMQILLEDEAAQKKQQEEADTTRKKVLAKVPG